MLQIAPNYCPGRKRSADALFGSIVGRVERRICPKSKSQRAEPAESPSVNVDFAQDAFFYSRGPVFRYDGSGHVLQSQPAGQTLAPKK